MKTKIIKIGIIAFITVMAAISTQAQTATQDSVKTVKHCLALKSDKTQCKGVILMKNGYCSAHNPDAIHCSGKTAKGEPCKMVVKVKGEYCRFHQK